MSSGTLYIVATPIGNLQDFSVRAQQTLASVDFIAAEDTRHSKPLLQSFQITTPMVALHEHNENSKSIELIQQLKRGKSIALISDAGTPLISDPGYQLVKLAHQHQIPVSPIPGPCAFVSALSAAGLPSDQFHFVGFLPAKSSARRDQLQPLADSRVTLVFYVSPHRLQAELLDMIDIFGGERLAVLARELTKKFETIKQLPLAELAQFIEQDPNQQKGEFVLMIAGKAKLEKAVLSAEAIRIFQCLSEELSLKQAAALAAKITGIRKKVFYEYGLNQEDK